MDPIERPCTRTRRCISGRDPFDKKSLRKTWRWVPEEEKPPFPCKNKAVAEVLFIYGWLRSGPIILYVPVCEQHKQNYLECYMQAHIRPLKTCKDKVIEALSKEGWRVEDLGK